MTHDLLNLRVKIVPEAAISSIKLRKTWRHV